MQDIDIFLLLQIFIVVHIKPHPKKKGLQSTNCSKYKGHCIDIWYISSHSPDIEQTYCQGNTGSEEDKGKEEKEYEGMKILYHILKNKSLPKTFE